jgi:hypothetical protein
VPCDPKKTKPAYGLNFTEWQRSRGMTAVRTIGLDEPLASEAQSDGREFVWIRYPADQAPRDGVEYVSAVDGQGPGPSVDVDTLAAKLADRIAARAVADRSAPSPLPILLKVPEAARLASMTERALRHLIQRSQLPRGVVVWRGRAVYIDRERFERALRQPMPGRSSLGVDAGARRAGST